VVFRRLKNLTKPKSRKKRASQERAAADGSVEWLHQPLTEGDVMPSRSEQRVSGVVERMIASAHTEADALAACGA
jgi:hypothetical protein